MIKWKQDKQCLVQDCMLYETKITEKLSKNIEKMERKH